MKRRIAFICNGNICRSPMAEIIAGDWLATNAADSFRVSSAGTFGFEGFPADDKAVRAVGELGLDLSAHRCQPVTEDYLRDHGFWVAMDPSHGQDVQKMAYECLEKVVRLWEHTSTPGRVNEVFDPIGLDPGAFVECRDLIHECLQNWLPQIICE